MKKVISIFILMCFLVTGQIGVFPVVCASAYAVEGTGNIAQDFRLPVPGVAVHLSPAFNPPILKGIKVHPDNPFRFDFILDKGDSKLSNNVLKEESSKLIKYFLASLTIPEKDLWVNLSPYEKDRIIPQSFGLTEMGRDLLAEDYVLKQVTASLIYPEDKVGKIFWKRIYQQAYKEYGTTNIPVSTFNKVWILPEKAVVFENAKSGTAYVLESKLKVMLEEDYLSLEKHEGIQSKLAQTRDTNLLGSRIVREVVIPELNKEVNNDKNFSQLRQVFNSLILANWYKKKIKDSILSQVYEDKNKIQGVNNDDPQEKERIYQRYLQAFKKGVYNYIKDEIDPSTNQTIFRRYFSGGECFNAAKLGVVTTYTQSTFLPKNNPSNFAMVSANLQKAFSSMAMTVKAKRKVSSNWKIIGVIGLVAVAIELAIQGFNYTQPLAEVNLVASLHMKSNYRDQILKLFDINNNEWKEDGAKQKIENWYRNTKNLKIREEYLQALSKVSDLELQSDLEGIIGLDGLFYPQDSQALSATYTAKHYKELLDKKQHIRDVIEKIFHGEDRDKIEEIIKQVETYVFVSRDIIMLKDPRLAGAKFIFVEEQSLVVKAVQLVQEQQRLFEYFKSFDKVFDKEDMFLLEEMVGKKMPKYAENIDHLKNKVLSAKIEQGVKDDIIRNLNLFEETFNDLDVNVKERDADWIRRTRLDASNRLSESNRHLGFLLPRHPFQYTYWAGESHYGDLGEKIKKENDFTLRFQKDYSPENGDNGTSSHAMTTKIQVKRSFPHKISTGGIDMSHSVNVLQTQNTGEGIKFHIDPAQLARYQNASGFTVDMASITIQPLNSLSAFLGITVQEKAPISS